MSGTIDATDPSVGRVPPHEHVRDQLAAVIADAPDTLTAANRCVHVLVLLGLLPETDR